jgi:hypothetical protein
VPGAADQVSIINATWINRNARGVLNVVATSTLPSTTQGLQLFIQATASNGAQLAPTPQPMSLVRNLPGQLPVCFPVTSPCWQYIATGVIANPLQSGNFLAPVSITVTSSFGGVSTISGSAIRLR